MGKKLLIGLGAVMLIVMVLFWQRYTSLDRIVVTIVEDVASDVLNSRVIVSGMSVDLAQGKANIDGLTIANPQGYLQQYILDMKRIEVDFQPNSIQQNPVIIESIRINSPTIFYEGHGPGGSNMEVLLKNIENATAVKNTTGTDKKPGIIIGKLEFSGGLIKASSMATPHNIKNVGLPVIEILGIGRSKGGVSMEEATTQVAYELISGIISAVVKAGADRVIKNDGVLDSVREHLKQREELKRDD